MADSPDLLIRVKDYVQQRLPVDSTGHDWLHCQRVARLALEIAQEEPAADLLHVELAAWLHDVHDWKFAAEQPAERRGQEKLIVWLLQNGASQTEAEALVTTIEEISFKGAGVATVPSTIEGKIVQDADRLEALGAIGIARCFAYGGYKRQALWDPSVPVQSHNSFGEYKTKTSTSVNHFFEKLLLLKERMNTRAGRALAESRHEHLLSFLKALGEDLGVRLL